MARLRLAAGCCGSCSLFGVLPCFYPHAALPIAQHHHRYAGLRSQAPFVARMYPRNGGASVMALQNALEGSGSAGRAGLSIHFKISLKIKNALYECACGFCLSFQAVTAFAAGFVAVGIPVCLNPVFSPRVWTLRGFPSGAALCPIREGAP